MKKGFKSVVSVLLAMSMLLLIQLPVFADEGTTTQINLSLLNEGPRPNKSKSNNGNYETRLERHNKMVENGFELVALYEVDQRYSDSVIEGTRLVYSEYQRSYNIVDRVYLDDMLNDVYDVSSAVVSALSYAPFPLQFSWIPNLLGFTSQNIINQMSSGQAVFTSSSSYRYCDIEVKERNWPYWYVNARSDTKSVSTAVAISGYRSDNRNYSASANGSATTKSRNYGNDAALTDLAVYYVHNVEGLWYEETADDPIVVPAKSTYRYSFA